MTLPGNKNEENGRALAGVMEVLEKLLGPEGCPWDKEQTVESLCAYALEEMYELVDAVRNGSPEEQREETGDVLFILLFMSCLQERAGRFTLAETLEENRVKMIGRHPHVFGDVRVEGREELFSVWEKVKREEKAKKNSRSGVFASLPAALPSLLKAYRIHSKSAQYNFTWDTDEDAEMQVEAEWLEFIDACREGEPGALEHELGDLLFSIVELGRRRGLKAETALDKANTRFLRRFAAMESLAAERGLDFASLSQAEKDGLWEEIKRGEGR
jgi:ATP diphosphatase